MPKPKKRKGRGPVVRLWRSALARIAPSRAKPRSTPPMKWSEDEILRAVAPVRAGRKLTPAHWPDGARVAACISFDVDNETPSLSRGETAPSQLSAGAYEFDLAYEEGTYFMLTLHPHVIGHRSRIVHLDRFIAGLKARQGVWFATAEEIAAYVKMAKSRDRD